MKEGIKKMNDKMHEMVLSTVRIGNHYETRVMTVKTFQEHSTKHFEPSDTCSYYIVRNIEGKPHWMTRDTFIEHSFKM